MAVVGSVMGTVEVVVSETVAESVRVAVVDSVTGTVEVEV